MNDYPRDLIGYGRDVPHAQWPNGARIAVQFVLNYEEGAENCVLHGDQASEQFLSEIIGAPAFAARHLSMESIYEYGSRVGVWRILRSSSAGNCRSPSSVYRWRCSAIRNSLRRSSSWRTRSPATA